MRSLALVALAAFPFLGVVLLAWVWPGQSFASRYGRARQRTAAMAKAADIQLERNEAPIARLDANLGRPSGGDVRGPVGSSNGRQ